MANTSSSQANILLVAHGAAGERADGNTALIGLADEVRHGLPDFCVEQGFLSQAEALDKVLASLADGPVIVLPLLFSRGYFLSRKLEPLVERVAATGADIFLDAPLIEWPEFEMAVASKVLNHPTMFVAHGSSRSSGSRLAAEKFASSVSARTGAPVSCSFLEEEPFAKLAISSSPPNGLVLGLFMASGLHGASDFAEVMQAAPYQTISGCTVGEMETLGEVIIARARSVVSNRKN